MQRDAAHSVRAIPAVKSDVRIEREKQLTRDERATRTELEQFIRQHPTKRFLGTNFYLWAYNSADPDKTNWWNRFKRRIGKRTRAARLDTDGPFRPKA